jgi:hypothetical protein
LPKKYRPGIDLLQKVSIPKSLIYLHSDRSPSVAAIEVNNDVLEKAAGRLRTLGEDASSGRAAGN